MQLKSYAKAQGIPRALGNSDTQGIRRGILLITMIAVLDVFILFFAIGTTAYTYEGIYIKAKKKKKPGIPNLLGVSCGINLLEHCPFLACPLQLHQPSVYLTSHHDTTGANSSYWH